MLPTVLSGGQVHSVSTLLSLFQVHLFVTVLSDEAVHAVRSYGTVLSCREAHSFIPVRFGLSIHSALSKLSHKPAHSYDAMLSREAVSDFRFRRRRWNIMDVFELSNRVRIRRLSVEVGSVRVFVPVREEELRRVAHRSQIDLAVRKQPLVEEALLVRTQRLAR